MKHLINIPIVTDLILVKGVASHRKNCTILEVITRFIEIDIGQGIRGQAIGNTPPLAEGRDGKKA